MRMRASRLGKGEGMWQQGPEAGTFYRNLVKLGIGFMGKPCESACMHCKGRGGGGAGEKRPVGNPRKPVSCHEAMRVAQRIDEWRKERGVDLLITFGGADTPDYPGVFDEMRFVRRLYNRRGFACNGMAMRTRAELDEWFREAKEAGTKIVFTTFYGTREFHDWFAGRDGDFDLMIDTAKAIAHNGLYNCHTLFVSKSTTPYLAELSDILDALPGKKHLGYRPILNKMEVLTDESERYTRDEYLALPERYRKAHHYPMGTRREWRDHVLGDRFREDTRDERLHTIIDVGDVDLEAFYARPVEAFLDEVIDAELAKRERTPTVRELAERYGDRRIDSELLFTLFDLHMEWMYLWRQEHPGFVPYYATIE